MIQMIKIIRSIIKDLVTIVEWLLTRRVRFWTSSHNRIGKILYVADLAKQDILRIMVEDKTTTSLIKGNKDCDDVKLLGPHSLVISSSKSIVYFIETWYHPEI